DLQHEIFNILFDRKLALAPVGEPAHVLDIATGTGIWAFEFAEAHPISTVVGTDLSMIQPSALRLLPNCSFVREDSEEPWVFDYKFDYVHARAVVSCFNDTRVVLARAFEGMNEGGWIEFQDINMDVRSIDHTLEGTAVQEWFRTVRRGFASIGRDVDRPLFYKQWFLEAGFVDVEEKCFPIPLNQWPESPKSKEVGRFQHANACDGIPGVSAKVLPLAGLSSAEAQDLSARAVRDSGNTRIHAYTPLYVVYGRKPFATKRTQQLVG
ncbi:S-adenosyl-L-methionine-dependent methyltransferase, partial [Pseudomassariella vexata]